MIMIISCFVAAFRGMLVYSIQQRQYFGYLALASTKIAKNLCGRLELLTRILLTKTATLCIPFYFQVKLSVLQLEPQWVDWFLSEELLLLYTELVQRRFITKTCPCNIQRFYDLSNLKIFIRKCLIFFLFLLKT